MSYEAKKGYGSTVALFVLGMLTLYLGARWLLVLIPAAVLIWIGTASTTQQPTRLTEERK